MSTLAESDSAGLKNQKVRVPKQDRAVKAKRAILEAAMVLFSDKGFHQTNSKEIAAAANVSIGTFYSYYPDKRELFKAAIEVYSRRFNDELYSLLAGFDLSIKDPVERRKVLRSFITSLMAAHKVYEGFHDELVVMHLSDPEIHEVVMEKNRQSRSNILGFLKNAKGLVITDLEAAAAILYDMVHCVVDTVVFKKTNLDDERLLQSLGEAMDRFLFGT